MPWSRSRVRSGRGALPLVVLVGLVALFGACTDEAREGQLTIPEGSAPPTPTPSPTPPDASSDPRGDLPEATIASYVAEVCGAIDNFRQRFLAEFAVALLASFQATRTSGGTADADGDDVLAPLVELGEQLVIALAAAIPPEELRDYHARLIAGIAGELSALRDGAPLAPDGAAEALPTIARPPAELAERVALAASRVPACVDVGFGSTN